MPADHDEVDQLLRGAMKVLDAETPSGYFDHLPQLTLARLQDGTMQTSTTGQDKSSDANFESQTALPPTDREDDSGLHDIRSLAQSTKARLSQNNMAAARAPTHDDEILSTSSGAWKAVALPEPAMMVSLPDVAELPSKKALKAREKAEKKAEIPSAIATGRPANVTPIGPRIAARPSSSTKIIAFAGLGIAAAAGITFFVINRGGAKPTETVKPSVVAIATPIELPRARPEAQVPMPPAPAEVKQELAVADTAVATGSAATPATPATPAATKAATKPVAKVGTKKDASVQTAVGKDEGKKTNADKAKPSEPGDPNFDDLLNEAGVDKTKKVVAPKLDKKSLSSGDIKTGMNGVAGTAAACYAGTQGTAAVHLTVTPDGKVKSVNVNGVFANTPVAACVAAAVRGASFPGWDGGPQSFNYSYLLQER